MIHSIDGNNDDGEGVRHDSTSTDLEYDAEFEVLVNAFLRDMDYTSTRQAVFNIVYSIINSGLIALPFAAYLAGIPLFITIVGVISLISGYVSIMVISMANEQRVRTLEDLAQCAFGPNGFILVCAFQWIFSFSLMCVTLDIFAEIMDDVFQEIKVDSYILTHRRGQVLLGALLIFPLCILKKSMSSLRWTSYFTVLTVAAALLGVVTTYVTDMDVSDTASNKRVNSPQMSSFWSAILIVLFCYSYNQKVFMIYSCLRRRSADRWGVAVRRANLIISLLYIVFGVFGYVSRDRIGELMEHNYFLDNRDENKVMFDVARIAVAFCLLLTIPVDTLVASTTARRIISRYRKSKFEKKLQKHLCCYSTKSSNGGSFTALKTTSDEDDIEEQRHMAEQLSRTSSMIPQHSTDHAEPAVHNALTAPSDSTPNHMASPSKPRSASGSKKYMKQPAPATQQQRGISHSTGSVPPVKHIYHNPAATPTRAILKNSVDRTSPTPPVQISVANSPAGVGMIGSVYRSLLAFSPAPHHNVTEINTSLNSRQNEQFVQEALQQSSTGYDDVSQKLRNTQSTASANDSYSFDSSHNMSYSYGSAFSKHNDEIAAILQQAGQAGGSDNAVPGLGPGEEQGDRSFSMSKGSARRSVSFVEHPNALNFVANFDEEEEARASDARMSDLDNSMFMRSDTNSFVVPGDGVKMNKVSPNSQHLNTYVDDPQTSYRTLSDDNEFRIRAASSDHVDDFKRVCPTAEEVVPAIIFWLMMIIVCTMISMWTYLATVATIVTVVLLFIFPTMFYFRLGLASDYQARPYFGIVPNRFFMTVVQVIGILMLLYEVGALTYNIIEAGVSTKHT